MKYSKKDLKSVETFALFFVFSGGFVGLISEQRLLDQLGGWNYC